MTQNVSKPEPSFAFKALVSSRLGINRHLLQLIAAAGGIWLHIVFNTSILSISY